MAVILNFDRKLTFFRLLPYLDLHLSVSNGVVSFKIYLFIFYKIYDKLDDFDFDLPNFRFLDGDVPRRPFYGVYISELVRFPRVYIHVTLMLEINV